MNKKQLDRLRQSLRGWETVGFALSNTNQRLCKYFGARAALSVESTEQEGTCVSFVIADGKEDYDKDYSG